MIPTREKPLSAEAMERFAQPIFVQRVAQELACSEALRDEDLYGARSEKVAQEHTAYLVRATTERLAHETASRISLFARTMLPVSVEQTDTVTWPDGWWQAFRTRWLPHWWLRRHPAKYRRESLTASIDMTEVLKACMEAPDNGLPNDTVMVRPSIDFTRGFG